MSLGPGTRLGPYEVVAAIGAGGMGEVYRARDTRLDRTVAIKVLPAAVADDPTFRERFDREARAVAALNHPHICALYDIGEDAGTAFLVMEYLEGDTLADRLAKGALPIDQALKYAIQIAEALDKAHRAGIVHRDLKPGNIMLTKSGAKLLDFGLAKASPAAGLSSLSILPTAHSPVTAQGTILGTLQYMAPKQVEGREADARSDIFAFGAIVYEMVTGKRAFEGKSQASVIAAILDREPPAMSSLQPLAPALLDHLVQRCLAKDPDTRWQTASDVMRELSWVSSRGFDIVPARGSSPRRTRLLLVGGMVVVVLAAFAAGASMRLLQTDAPATSLTKLSMSLPPNTPLGNTTGMMTAVVSPDGKRVVFGAMRGGNVGSTMLWIRTLSDLDPHPLTGTDLGRYPFWSPDSRKIGFFASGKLKVIDIESGEILSLTDVSLGSGATWSANGQILFAPSSTAGGLFRISVAGGQPTPVTRSDSTRRENFHRFPVFLPDGDHFIFLAFPANRILVGSLSSESTHALVQADSQAQYTANHLLFLRQGTLFAQPFDVAAGATTGEPVAVATQVLRDAYEYGVFSAAENGVLAYRAGGPAQRTQLMWLDRSGRTLGTVGEAGYMRNPALSPDDGTRVLFEIVDVQGRNQDIWIQDIARNVRSRLTFDPANDIYPVWSPDGGRVVFASDRDSGVFNIYQKPANGVGDDQRVVKSSDDMTPYSMSPDGRFLIYRLNINDTGIMSLSGDPKPSPLLKASFNQNAAQVSPDGRWLAYYSNESGVYEVYIRNFGAGNGKWQVSQGGGVHPRWRRDGKELYYYASDGHLMAVSISGDSAANVGTPHALFEANLLNGPQVSSGFRAQYEPSPDGQRFLMNVPVEGSVAVPMTLILNWREALNK
jgi:serine/threonine protein kinase/Tol biopolymer transport system component